MKDFISFTEESEMELLDEAGNISSGVAIRKHSQILKFGKEVVKARSVEDKLDMLARLGVGLGGMILLAIANSGSKSFGSSIAKALSMRGL
mgnify:FL=1